MSRPSQRWQTFMQEPRHSTAPDHDSPRDQLYDVIFGFESRAGRLFDLLLIILILSSVLAVLLDSVPGISARWHRELHVLEWAFTILFTVEYGLRLYSARSRGGYALSFYGIVDLLSILPTYLVFLMPGAQALIVIRILRVLRIFRILKLMRYIGEANLLLRALRAASRKIFVFLYGVLTVIVIFGSLMFLVEGPENGFTSIPTSIYWAIVTLTTVGYGDITPHTPLGQAIAALAMITGYAIIAVPTGIIGSELMGEYQRSRGEKDYKVVCSNCKRSGHDRDAHYCKQCGVPLEH